MKIKTGTLTFFILLANWVLAQSTVDPPAETNDFFLLPPLNFWYLLPLILIVGVCIYVMLKFSSINEKLSNTVKSEIGVSDSNIISQKSNIKQTVNKNEIEKFILDSDKISEINDAISKLQIRLSEVEKNNSNKDEYKITSKEIIPNEEVFYMGKPVDNYFHNSNKLSTKINSIYKFTVKQNKSVAIFEIHTGGAPVDDIAKRNEAYIKPACDEENIPGTLVSNIITKSKGVAMLEGDKWIIKTKAVIRYE